MTPREDALNLHSSVSPLISRRTSVYKLAESLTRKLLGLIQINVTLLAAHLLFTYVIRSQYIFVYPLLPGFCLPVPDKAY